MQDQLIASQPVSGWSRSQDINTKEEILRRSGEVGISLSLSDSPPSHLISCLLSSYKQSPGQALALVADKLLSNIKYKD